ncbi:MAG: hypothetical protein IPG90_00725 [Bacteroidetes bacterium]|jgi:hypothetical protein|nr:hypothetical protein [Bacteroidota bacterium]MBP6401367.1 hypothetical protein [Bacteroidia bacterium]MBK6836961.1 hypothetical protein [Bacteroidota bacterium]MBK9523636.1 hypothetical protein [Bacteroidota bacterium]MBK9541383.1 hypothetical protein [Bacteroidota bacterium]
MKLYRSRKVISAGLIIIVGITFHSCKYDTFENEPCQLKIPDEVSFHADILPVLRENCSTVGCHSGGNPTGHLNLDDSLAYGELSRAGSGYINTNIPTHSLFYSQLISISQPMPPNGKLDDCTIEMILRWIKQGALNN